MTIARETADRLLAPALPAWNPDADDVLVVRAIRQETHDVKTFVLASREPRRFHYRPGQFITLDVEIGGETVNRCYTLSSAPTRPDTIAITVKRVPGGPVSNALHDTLKVGSEIRAVGPMGDFSCFGEGEPRPAPAKYLFLSGGSGITPLMSMARTFHDLGEPRDIVFVHAARSPADIVFRTELELMARNQPENFRLVPVCEAGSPGEPWNGFAGRLSLPMLKLIAPDLASREVFVCGPSPFMAAVRGLLKEAGFDMTRHHEESFSFEEMAAADPEVATEVVAATLGEAVKAAAAEAAAEVIAEIVAEAAAQAPSANPLSANPPSANASTATAPSVAPPAPAAEAVPVYQVTFTKSGKTIEVPGDRSVLDVARRAGIRLPSSCSKGLCGTCKSKIISGTVEMKHQGGIRQREIDAGMALLCCSKPTSDLVVDR
ncbi:hybrid-cluster NAD(P)-dependent oxidoreductase [Ancylobacter sp. 6x-1]|uniref:Hybrid-cluster NAD(P)-dependent oxidoreductase n=1 Tax=Ancylobacter crimeensis TaxID=2579147 RepID=A0ABT0DEI0_9HYPH|nr:hybrid-cluster NAD(P)-dependent oxidoreductase [Ancylobacter crimeensis]MCK0198356.1 hybrid-cluster NAD(P)-dependent oxidoreductase [Ancylobacter crimeensis]